MLDATTGQNGLEQARKFTESSGVTGIVLDQARRHGQGRHRGGHRARAEPADPLRRRRRKGRRPAAVRSREVHRIALRKMNRWILHGKRWTWRGKGAGAGQSEPDGGRRAGADGEVVGRGFHTYAGVKHAEIIALEQAGERARGATSTSIWNPAPTRAAPALRRRADRGRCGARVSRHAGSQSAGAREGFRRLREAGIEVEMSGVRRRGRKAERAVRPLHAHRPSAGDAEDRHHAGRQDRRARRQSRLDHQRARPRPRAAAAARLTTPSSPASARCWPTIACSPTAPACQRSRPLLRIVLDSQLRLPLDSQMVRSAAGRRAGGHHLRGLRRAAARRWRTAASRCWSATVRAGAPTSTRVVDWLAQRALSLADDRGRQQAQLDGARIRRGGQDLLLLRAQDSGRPGIAAAGRRHRARGGRATPSVFTTSRCTRFRRTNSPSK